MLEPAYRYFATARRVQDGDSLIVDADLGFYASMAIPVRLAGVDTPELRSRDEHERQRARLAAAFVHDQVAPDDVLPWSSKSPIRLEARAPLLLVSHKDDRSFERWVCDVYVLDGDEPASLAERLVDAAHGSYVVA